MIQSVKPFFSLMIRICFMYGGVVFYFIGLLYFTLFGRQIIELLDSSCLYAVYRSYHKKRSIVFIIFVCNTLIWLINDMPHILQIYETSQIHYLIISMGCLYAIGILSNLVIYVIFYYQHATKVALSKIENSLSNKESDIGMLIHFFKYRR